MAATGGVRPVVLLRLTLDTNAFIYAFDFGHASPVSLDAVNALVAHAFRGAVNLALASAASRDLEADSDEGRRSEMLRKLGLFPLVPSPFRIGSSKLDGPDVLVDSPTAEIAERIEGLLHPGGLDPASPRFQNDINDVDHLVAHRMADRDLFVTLDTDVLRKAKLLKAEVGIEVVDAEQALERVERTVNVALVAEDFTRDFVKVTRLYEDAQNVPEDALQQEYNELRPPLLRSWPKLRQEFGRFRADTESAPLGGALVLSGAAGERLKRDIDPPARFIERERFVDGLRDVLVWSAKHHADLTPISALHRETERCRTLLRKFIGHLEARR